MQTVPSEQLDQRLVSCDYDAARFSLLASYEVQVIFVALPGYLRDRGRQFGRVQYAAPRVIEEKALEDPGCLPLNEVLTLAQAPELLQKSTGAYNEDSIGRLGENCEESQGLALPLLRRGTTQILPEPLVDDESGHSDSSTLKAEELP